MERENGYTSIVQCKIIVVLTTPSVIDGFSHLRTRVRVPVGMHVFHIGSIIPVLNYCSLPVFS